MKDYKKIILFLFIIPLFLFGFGVGSVSAQTQNNTALIAQLEQEIQNLIRQIIALLQQQIQAKILSNANLNTNSGTATLTVNATGVTAYVSINGGNQFAYASPITLNNGDSYSVTASSSGGGGNSTSKCNGVASSGGSYVCNIKIIGT